MINISQLTSQNTTSTYMNASPTKAVVKEPEASSHLVVDTPAAVYEKSTELNTELRTELSSNKTTYKPDMEKIKAMKDETDQRLIDLFKSTVKGGTLKQLGGLRGFIDLIKKGNGNYTLETADEESSSGNSLKVTIEITQETVEKAQADIAEDGYWGAKATSDRFVDFAKALSGGDSSKASLLIDAFKEGYRQAEELWGSQLPELSKQTYDLTLEKLDAWMNEA